MNPYRAPPLPLDAQGFTLAFSLDADPKGLEEFYRTYGLLVFRDVISQLQVELTIDALWETVVEMSEGEINRADPATWNFRSMLRYFGFVDHKPLSHLQIWRNRQHPNVYRSFKTGYQVSSGKPLEEPLLSMFDRGSLIRPSKSNPEWKTEDIYHFDIDPWEWTGQDQSLRSNWRSDEHYQMDFFSSWLGEGNYFPKTGPHTKLAGVLALSDTNQESGGFEAACGFQNHIQEWCKKNKRGTHIDSDPQLLASFQKVFLRKGSLLLFSRQLPHNIYPNISDSFRYAQYLRMAPESTFLFTESEKKRRADCVKQMIPSGLEVNNQISREIFMIEEASSLRKKGCVIM